MIQQQFPSGLQALLGRQQPRQKATIPPGLNALMQAQEVLRQQANPTTPEGTPTVAGQTEQAIQQQMQPQPQMQPQGMPGMMPTDPFREQLMKTLQMQAQQQMQGQPQQPPQQPPQGMASGGIAALPADNMARMEQYAHGGVIGFDGEDGSFVDRLPEESWLKQLANWMKSGRPSLDRPLIDIGGPEQAASKERAAPTKAEASDYEKLRTLSAYADQNRPSTFGAAPSEAPSVTATKKPSEPRAPAAPAGLKMSPEVSEAYKWLLSQRNQAFTQERPDQAAMRAQDEAERAAQGLKGLVGSRTEEAIKAAEARDLALRAKYEKGLEGRGLENLITALSAGARGTVGSLGGAYARTAQEQRAADLQFEQLMNASAAKRDEMAASVDAMREAKATGNVKAYRDAEQQYNKSKTEDANIKRLLGSTALEVSSGMQEKASERALREREMGAQRAMSEQSKYQTLLVEINKQIGIKAGELREKLEKNHPMIKALEISPKPEDKRQLQEIKAGIESEIKAATAPLEMQRLQLLNKLGGVDLSKWGQMSVQPSR